MRELIVFKTKSFLCFYNSYLLQLFSPNSPNKAWSKFQLSRYRKAAEEYCQAASLHYQAGSVESALSDLLLAHECFKKKRNWFPAAKTLEQVILLTIKRKRCDHDRQLLKDRTLQAASLFRKSGHPDSAASLLEKVAKVIQIMIPILF